MTGRHRERDAVLAYFTDRAARTDAAATDPRAGLRLLGEHGLLALGAPGEPDSRPADMVGLVEQVAARCLSSAFSLWAHRMVVEYLARAGTEASAAHLPGLRDASTIGSTAMAPALRELAGIEPIPVTAVRTGAGLVLNGPIRWASNLVDGALIVLPARLADGGRAVVRVRVGDPGVRLDPRPRLLALNATASSSFTLKDVEVAADAVLAEDLPRFVGSVRPVFLLLQTAFCAGLAGAAVQAAAGRLTGVNAGFAGRAEEVAARYGSVRERLHRFAERPEDAAPPELLRLRLEAAGVAGEAARLEATVHGGPGYLAASPTSRRLREAAFLPVQSPTEGHLRWELSRHA